MASERRYDLFVQDEAVVDDRERSANIAAQFRVELANVDVETHMQDTTAINKATAIFSHLATNNNNNNIIIIFFLAPASTKPAG